MGRKSEQCGDRKRSKYKLKINIMWCAKPMQRDGVVAKAEPPAGRTVEIPGYKMQRQDKIHHRGTEITERNGNLIVKQRTLTPVNQNLVGAPALEIEFWQPACQGVHPRVESARPTGRAESAARHF